MATIHPAMTSEENAEFQKQKLQEYKICQKRGHSPSGLQLTCNPPLEVCKYCGTNYRFEEKELTERNIPEE